jgi:hypothetical protein
MDDSKLVQGKQDRDLIKNTASKDRIESLYGQLNHNGHVLK